MAETDDTQEQDADRAGAALKRSGRTLAVAVTGVGGPGPQDGEPPGTVWTATWPDQLGEAILLRLSGSPESICEQVCARAARLLRERLAASFALVPRGRPRP